MVDAALQSLISHKMSKSAYSVHIDNAQTWLGKLELNIRDLEEVLECLSRHIVKTRVSLLNILNHKTKNRHVDSILSVNYYELIQLYMYMNETYIFTCDSKAIHWLKKFLLISCCLSLFLEHRFLVQDLIL
jgi:hypothetical protein